MRDQLYEREIQRHQRSVLVLLAEYRSEPDSEWQFKDLLAVQRALQVLIESYIGLARYLVEQLYGIKLAKSREAVDELRRRAQLSEAEHRSLLKMIGFRNVLVHDYLDVDDEIVKAVVIKGDYLNAQQVIERLWLLAEGLT